MARILIIAPHPDDEVLGCGGSIAVHAAAGHEVAIAFLTSGEHGGSAEVDDLGTRREREAVDAAATLGVRSDRLRFLRFPDGGIDPYDRDQFGVVLELLRESRPDLLYLPHPKDGSFDHEAAFALCWRAVQMAGSSNYPQWGRPHWVSTIDDLGTLTAAVAGAAAWLRDQLRPDGQWREPESWAANPTDRVAWWNTAGQITARMPDLADLLHQAVDASRTRGGILAMTVQVGSRSAHWRPAQAEHRSYRALTKALTNAAKHGRVLAAAVGVQPRPGLDAARTAHRAAHALPQKPAQLAGQWYPQQAGMAEPTEPAGRPGSPRTPGRGRTR